ncbi:MAG: single-stranded DNA exonuclease [Sulfolobaceae archaeon]
METFLNPNAEISKKLLEKFSSLKSNCLKVNYDLDSLLFAYIISKEFKDSFYITFTSNCPNQLLKKDNNKILIIEGNEINIGRNSFCTLLPITTENFLGVLVGIMYSSIFERRQFTEEERSIINNSKNYGIVVENSIKLINYKELPVFLSLILTIDPYIVGVSGNKASALSIIRELNISETAKLEELDEPKLNSLLYRIVSNILKYNPKFTREDLFSERIFYERYDILELAIALAYSLDIIGSSEIFKFIYYNKYIDIIIDGYRKDLSKDFEIKEFEDKGSYYVVSSELRSPLLLSLILKQMGKIKSEKPIYIKIDNELYTTRYFMKSQKEGLIKIESKN